MRVLHVDTATEWRGGQTQLLHLVGSRPGDAVVLHPEAPLRDALPHAHTIGFRGAIGGVRRLRRLIQSLQPDLVAAHTSHAHTQAILASGSVPVVVHRRLDFRPGGDPLTRLKYRAPVGYVAVSGAVRDVLVEIGVAEERIRVVHDGVDRSLADRAPRERDPDHIVAAGALVAHKDHRTLVRAMAEVDGRCSIAGEGPLREALAAEIHGLGLGGRVALLGQLDPDTLWDLIASATVFCHCSAEEGMGQVVVEAMLLGTPVVATRAGGVPEVIADTGDLVPPSRPGSLAVALRKALQEPRDGGLGRERALEHFGIEAMVRGTTNAYETLPGTQTR